MKIVAQLARGWALIAVFASSFAFNLAHANHYILPCPPNCRDAGDIAIGPGMTGTWFNANQNGQGLSIEVLPGQPLQLMVTWFVFAPEGGQSWITAQGPAVGMQAVLPAYQMSGPGARFPPAFDRTNVHADPWGTLTLRFSDCNRGRVAWVSSVPGYGSGILEIERLTLPAGLVCTEGTGSNAAEADDMPSEFPLR